MDNQNQQTPQPAQPPQAPPYQQAQPQSPPSPPNQQQTPPSQQNPQRQQAAERIKQANNILVTVSNNPTVDQLAACIGLTLALNRLNKHATAVFSGAVPSTIEFLQPEKTIEKNTDSLRDFIIALDKSKADKLRYKVEDSVVKIFITPYRTSISEKDLQFSQGDFNVDVVVALGVHNQNELDQAITAHGRILHDASVITMNVKPGGELGAINWLDQRASSLSELVVQLVDTIDKRMLDPQMATALLTGIVAETQRFSNKKTSAFTMSYSAELMAAGANQQLVATKLEPPAPPPPPPPPPKPAQPVPQAQQPVPQKPAEPPKSTTEGTLEIQHEEEKQPLALQDNEQSFVTPIDIDQEGTLRRIAEQQSQAAAQLQQPQVQPAQDQSQAQFTAPPPAQPPPQAQPPAPEASAQEQDQEKASTDPTAHMASQHHVLRPPSGQSFADSGNGTLDPPHTPLLHRPSEPTQDAETLTDLEKSIESPHVNQSGVSDNQNGTSGTTLPPPVPPPITPGQS